MSTYPPTQPGYTFARVQGWIYPPTQPQPPNTTTVKLWYSSQRLDHFTTASAADEAEAMAGGYTLLSVLGYMLQPNMSLPTAPKCFQRSGNIDWYLFGHGLNYSGALADFASIAGRIPIPRKHWLGMSWSRWGDELNETVTYGQVAALEDARFPLSTFIFDMQWHLKQGAPWPGYCTPATPTATLPTSSPSNDMFGAPDGWTGYTWDPVMFPSHTALLDYIVAKGLPVAVNLHDASGVQSFEARYPQMAAAMGLDPSSNATICFHITNRTYAYALQEAVLEPLAAEGVSFWWTDWQQGLPGVGEVTGMTPTLLLNHLRFTNYSQPGSTLRGLTHSRYGGWGNHRYASGFGGDVLQEWDSIAFMTYFTATATNVLFGYWGHEMMRDGGSPDDNTELFVRTMQFGAWSPVFTNWGNGGQDDNLWLMDPVSLNATRAVLMDRAMTLPYRYTLSKVAHDTGLSPLRPMYYDWPLAPDAYAAPGQYMMGSDILVAPVSTPADPTSGLADVSVWFPPGTIWVDWNNGSVVYSGGAASGNGTRSTLYYPVGRVPVFVRAGACIPMTPYADALPFGAASRDYTALQYSCFGLSVAATGTSDNTPFVGSAPVYEDDGISNDYLAGVSAVTTMSYNLTAVNGQSTCASFIVRATEGGYPGLPATRQYSWWLVATPLPTTVIGDGIALPQGVADGMPRTWWRDTATRTTRIYLSANASTVEDHFVSACW